MRIRENGKVFLLLYMFGFLFGIIYANTISKEIIYDIGIFSDSFLTRYVESNINSQKYMFYLIRLRVIPFLTLFVLGITRVKRIAVIVFLIWTGFLMGIITSASIIQMGMLGILFNVLSLVPHFFFYVMGYIILLLNISGKQKTKWAPLGIVVVILMFTTGLIMESYVNPVLVKMFLKTV